MEVEMHEINVMSLFAGLDAAARRARDTGRDQTVKLLDHDVETVGPDEPGRAYTYR